MSQGSMQQVTGPPEMTGLIIRHFRAEVARFFDDDNWTREKLYTLIWSSFPSENVEAALAAVDDALVKYGGYNDRDFRLDIMQKIALNLSAQLMTLDNFTRTGAMGIYPQYENQAEAFYLRSDAFYIETVSHPGSFAFISGPVWHGREDIVGTALGVGKTDSSLLMAQMFIRAGFEVVTNNEIKTPYEGLKELRSMRQLLITALDNFLNRGKFTVAIMDEFTQHMSKEYAGKREWVDLKKWLYLFRKFGIVFIVISQRGIEIPNAIAGMSALHIQKLNKFTMNVERAGRSYLIGQVPGTEVDFETYASGSFIFDDVNINEMHDMVAMLPKGESQLEAILRFLKAPNTTLTKQDRMTALKVIWIHGRGEWKIGEVADLVGVVRQTASKWLTEMGLRGAEEEEA